MQCAGCHIGKRGYDTLVKEGKIEAREKEAIQLESNSTKESTKPIQKFEVPQEKADFAKEKSLQKMIKEGNIPEDITLEDKEEVNPAIFSHKLHIAREKIRCTECHPNVFLMKVNRDADKTTWTMEQMEQGKYCGACHNGDRAFGVADDDFCDMCHPNN